MTDFRPLDHPARSALTGRHAAFAISCGGATRYAPGYGVFAALDASAPDAMADLARLIAEHGDVAFLESAPPPAGPGFAIASQDAGVQMVAEHVTAGADSGARIEPLEAADCPEMLALATLTQPGPFFANTPALGDFVGIRVDGALVAMAGERMKPDGFTEVSGVCTHPDHRGRGYAAMLMRVVAQRIIDRGEQPFLHAYASNTAAIALYRRLGFVIRREVQMTRLTRA
jgi:predicted GNAT family acetyltransferase